MLLLLSMNLVIKIMKLLGMPKENDWILNGIAFDTLFMRL